MSYIAVLGAGSWGSALCRMLAMKDYDISLWVYEKELAEEISKTGINSVYLPGFEMPRSIKISSNLKEVIKNSRYILNVIPTQFTRKVVAEASPYIDRSSVIISASKGIEQGSYLTVSGIIRQITDIPVAVLSGPSFSAEVVKGLPTAVTLASEDYSTCLQLQEVMSTDYFRVYSHHDVLGVELGGALKNVMAIASGICEGMELGNNARATLITRGLAEMTRLGIAMGAKEQTFSGLSGIGDLVLTCTSPLSRNYTIGFRLGRGEKLPDILSGTKSVAEGVATAVSAYELSGKLSVEMPIVEQIYNVLYRGKNPKDAVSDLMSRALKSEFHG